nr:MAG TPA: PolyVal ADP-Ribosyltransferase [Bacteriophage sp.]
MKAPNGKPTNLTERQWLQVRTKNFINWFGDWINNPTEASKIVDENGEPLVVYHGSARQFNSFRIDKIGSMSGDNSGFYFTNERSIAEDYYSKETGSVLGNLKLLFHIGNEYKSSVYDVFLNSKNPYITKVSDKEYINREQIIKEAREQGYDSVLFNDVIDGPTVRQDIKIVFNPNQIKSATSNTGEFSTTNDDIRLLSEDAT